MLGLVNFPIVLERASAREIPVHFTRGGGIGANPRMDAPTQRMSTSQQVVLLFHGIGDPRPDVDDDERPYWIDRSFFRAIVDMVGTGDFGREVVFTFDEGNKSDLGAAEDLNRAGLGGRFFILSSRLDKPHFLQRAEAQELVQAGMEVGLHGNSHVEWRGLNPEAWHIEVHEARTKVEDVIQRPIDSVAIPFGSYDRKVVRRLRRDGLERIYTADRGLTRSPSLLIRRTAITRACSLDDVRDLIVDHVRPWNRARRTIAPWFRRWR